MSFKRCCFDRRLLVVSWSVLRKNRLPAPRAGGASRWQAEGAATGTSASGERALEGRRKQLLENHPAPRRGAVTVDRRTPVAAPPACHRLSSGAASAARSNIPRPAGDTLLGQYQQLSGGSPLCSSSNVRLFPYRRSKIETSNMFVAPGLVRDWSRHNCHSCPNVRERLSGC